MQENNKKVIIGFTIFILVLLQAWWLLMIIGVIYAISRKDMANILEKSVKLLDETKVEPTMSSMPSIQDIKAPMRPFKKLTTYQKMEIDELKRRYHDQELTYEEYTTRLNRTLAEHDTLD